MPTIVLSNHPRYPECAGSAVAPDVLLEMFAALDANGLLADVDAVLTGYLPSAAHVAAAPSLIARVRARRPEALVVCDPVFGDDPGGLFLPESVAEAVRDRLLPLADVVKPNRFELSYLSGRPVDDPRRGGQRRAVAPPAGGARQFDPARRSALANVVVTAGRAAYASVGREEGVPRGTGDILGALLTGHLAAGRDAFESASRAVAGAGRMIAASRGHGSCNLPRRRRGKPRTVPALPISRVNRIDPP